jgi:hypothetical protein
MENFGQEQLHSPCVQGAPRLEVCLFRHCSFCHIHRECYRRTVPSVADLFMAWFS